MAKTLIIVGVVLLILCCLVLMCTSDNSSSNNVESGYEQQPIVHGVNCNCQEQQRFSNVVNNSSGLEVKYYYSPYCPHCVNFMSTWSDFESKAKNRASLVKINCVENPELCRGVTGVPHVVFKNGDKEVVYQGARNSESLEKFLNSM